MCSALKICKQRQSTWITTNCLKYTKNFKENLCTAKITIFPRIFRKNKLQKKTKKDKRTFVKTVIIFYALDETNPNPCLL